MATRALILYAVCLAIALGLRTVLQWRHTGSTGFHGVGARPGSAGWLAGVGFVLALVLGVAAPVLAAVDLAEPIDALDTAAPHLIGTVLALLGIAATFSAQVAMGTSWRIGVDQSERTELATSGPCALVRNPIFSAMLLTALGLVLVVPSWVAIVGLAGLTGALELQVRVIEEPDPVRTQGGPYDQYAARGGRFVPGAGQLRRYAHADR